MMPRLTDVQRSAIDAVLARLAAPESENSSKPKGPGASEVQAVEKVLQLLAHMPAADPPDDLAGRTLQRIAGSQPLPAPHPDLSSFSGDAQLPA